MKKVLIIIPVPTMRDVRPECLASVEAQDYPNFTYLIHVQYPIIGYKTYDSALNRNAIRDMVVHSDADYIFMLDSDTVIPKNTLSKLVADDKDVAGGWYQIRAEKEIATNRWAVAFYKEIEDKKYFVNYKEVQKGLIKVDMLGLGCILLKKEVYDKVPFDAGLAQKDIVDFPEGHSLPMGISARYGLDIQAQGYELYADGDVVCQHLIR